MGLLKNLFLLKRTTKIFLIILICFMGCSQTKKGTEQSILLNDIWVLESLNGIKVNKSDYPNGFPTLEFIDSNKTVTGFTGCNRLSGTYKLDNSKLTFSPLITTKMFCKGVNENDFLNALNSVNDYKIENLKLYLLQNDNAKLIFKKVD